MKWRSASRCPMWIMRSSRGMRENQRVPYLRGDPETDHVPGEAAEPAHDNQRANAKRACARHVTGEQCEQQVVRGREREHEAVDGVAVLRISSRKDAKSVG